MTNPVIPAEAVEAAARAFHENSRDSLANSLPWDDLTPEQVAAFWSAAISVIDVAAPYLLAEYEKRRKYAALDAISELGSDDPGENPWK